VSYVSHASCTCFSWRIRMGVSRFFLDEGNHPSNIRVSDPKCHGVVRNSSLCLTTPKNGEIALFLKRLLCASSWVWVRPMSVVIGTLDEYFEFQWVPERKDTWEVRHQKYKPRPLFSSSDFLFGIYTVSYACTDVCIIRVCIYIHECMYICIYINIYIQCMYVSFDLSMSHTTYD